MQSDIFTYTHVHLRYSDVCSLFTKSAHIYIRTCTFAHTGWRRLIGSRKLQIIFHKRAIKYWSLLRKMIYKDKGSYESSPPCIYTHTCIFEVFRRLLAVSEICTCLHNYICNWNIYIHTCVFEVFRRRLVVHEICICLHTYMYICAYLHIYMYT